MLDVGIMPIKATETATPIRRNIGNVPTSPKKWVMSVVTVLMIESIEWFMVVIPIMGIVVIVRIKRLAQHLRLDTIVTIIFELKINR
jgi:hypothetical protein